MNLLTLRYFCAVARHGNITQAADELHVSQPAVSKMIHGLEKELDVLLFQRYSGGVRLTTAGKFFYEKASEAVNALDAGIDGIRNILPHTRQRLRLVTFLSLGFLPKLYLAFQVTYPDIQLELRHISPTELPQQGQYDFAIIPATYLTEQHSTIPLLHEEFLLAVPKAYPLASQSSIDLAEAAPYDFLVMGSNAPAHQYLKAMCHLAQFQPKIAVNCDSISTLITFLEAGRGVCLLPAHSAVAGNDKFTLLPIRQPACSRTIHLCWPASQSLQETGLLFRDFCRDYVSRIPFND